MIEIVRVSQDERSTQGVMLIDGVAHFVTLELPWRNNAKNKSCIPEGKYKAFVVESPKFGITLWIADVPGRSEISVHAGNFPHDTLGCILLGCEYGNIAGQPMIVQSRRAMTQLRSLIIDLDSTELIIRSSYENLYTPDKDQARDSKEVDQRGLESF